MTLQSFTPSNDVEFSIYTTEPAWAFEDVNTNIDQFARDDEGKLMNDKDGKPIVVSSFWHTLRFLKRDFRLGLLQPKFDDFEWLENRLQLAQNLLSLRRGAFVNIAPMAIMPVVAKIELSQSRNALLRREVRTFRFDTKEESDKKKPGGLFGRLFG